MRSDPKMYPNIKMSEDESPFWAYSIRFYDDPKIQEACLKAQDKFGADVNLILYVLFRATAGRRIKPKAILKAIKCVESWHLEIVQPLRQIRRRLKDQPYKLSGDNQATIRRAIRNIELKSERFQQQHLETIKIQSDDCEPKQAARHNLAAYFNTLDKGISNQIFRLLLERFDALQKKPNR